MRSMKDIEVEPLSDARWSKIERGLFAQLDRDARPSAAPPERDARAWRWRPAAALVMAGAMAAAIGALATHSMWHGGPTQAATSRIVTGGAESHVALGEAALDVGPESALLVSGDDDRGITVVLDRGRVECEVAPRKGRPPFVVEAGDTRVRVIGTHFAVARAESGARVEVSKGVVEVTSHGEVFSVRAGEKWPTAQSADAEANANANANAFAGPAKSDPPVARPPRRASVRSNHSVAFPPHVEEPAASPPPAAAPPDPAPSPQLRYESAAKLEASDAPAALAIYRALASGSGPWAANALFAAGRLQADRGDRADAVRLLNDYLARFPRGPNAGDARDLLGRMR